LFTNSFAAHLRAQLNFPESLIPISTWLLIPAGFKGGFVCERPWGRALALPRSPRFAAHRRSRSRFQKTLASPMAEERWSVAVATVIQPVSEKVASPKIK
jgi:hypothetical protein